MLKSDSQRTVVLSLLQDCNVARGGFMALIAEWEASDGSMLKLRNFTQPIEARKCS